MVILVPLLLLLHHQPHQHRPLPTPTTGECPPYTKTYDYVLPAVSSFLMQIAVYKRLPFYTPLTNVTQAYTVNGTLFCSISLTSPACPTSRIAQPIHLRLTTEMLSKLQPKQTSNPYRLVLFSTQTERVAFGNCVIEFPPHTDIRCNGSPVQANVRGIKNRPGTINPPDVTAQIIMIQGVQNKIDVTFSDSKSSYTLTVYLVEKHTVAQLVEKIRKRGFISKDATLSKSMFPPA
jgi:hypothetical protein